MKLILNRGVDAKGAVPPRRRQAKGRGQGFAREGGTFARKTGRNWGNEVTSLRENKREMGWLVGGLQTPARWVPGGQAMEMGSGLKKAIHRRGAAWTATRSPGKRPPGRWN